jgi:AraC-like DNA-binding protein
MDMKLVTSITQTNMSLRWNTLHKQTATRIEEIEINLEELKSDSHLTHTYLTNLVQRIFQSNHTSLTLKLRICPTFVISLTVNTFMDLRFS